MLKSSNVTKEQGGFCRQSREQGLRASAKQLGSRKNEYYGGKHTYHGGALYAI